MLLGHKTGYLCGLAVFTATLLLGGCSKPASDESRLRHAVAAMQKAAEAKQPGPILAYLADDFVGNQVYRKANIRAMLLLHFHQNRHVQVFLRVTRIRLKANEAKMACTILLTGRDKHVIPERARPLVVDSVWQKRDGKWRVIRASWQDPLLQP
jgi:hypothetical protein